jgi:hypothetical protein
MDALAAKLCARFPDAAPLPAPQDGPVSRLYALELTRGSEAWSNPDMAIDGFARMPGTPSHIGVVETPEGALRVEAVYPCVETVRYQ